MHSQRQSRFANHKAHILAEIASPEPDGSPKGFIDTQIIPLINRLNEHGEVITTSSCSGRVSVFLEGVKKPRARQSFVEETDEGTGNASFGGKGDGGKWLFVSHDPVNCKNKTPKEVEQMLLGDLYEKISSDIIEGSETVSIPNDEFGVYPSTRFAHLKFEPMVR
jgi:tRNA wybutosine-synthesizing protein 3